MDRLNSENKVAIRKGTTYFMAVPYWLITGEILENVNSFVCSR